MKKFFITTAIGYVNGPPHIGHALEYIQADTIARFRRLLGERVFFLTGTDEHGSKIFHTAKKENLTPQRLADLNAKKFKELDRQLKISYDFFIRTSDKKHHWPGVWLLWQKLLSKGDIYKDKYKGLYCIGCEAFISEKELIGGKCPIHEKKPEVLAEENYFFRLSRYQETIKQLIKNNTLQIIPERRKNEIISIIQTGVNDLSFSRPKTKLPWGIPVPDDPNHVIYVWGDALANYITAIGFGRETKTFHQWWPADLHIVGKDILKFHAIYWPAMLLSAGLPLPKTIFVHGFVTSGEKKMSKSLGNIIDPFQLIKKFGPDSVRYYLLKEIPPTEDGDLTVDKFLSIYNGELANGLGNLISRVAALCEQVEFSFAPVNQQIFSSKLLKKSEPFRLLDTFQFADALRVIWKKIALTDKLIDDKKPWQLLKNKNTEGEEILRDLVEIIREIAVYLQPFLPETAEKILQQFKGPHIKKTAPLFPRIDV